MPTLAAPDLAILRQDPFNVKRYISICPRTTIFTCQVNGAALADSVSGGYYGFPYDNAVGTVGDVVAGLSVDIGTTAGASDIGTTHVRKAPSGGNFFIPETSAAKLPIADNYHVTVRAEHRPHRSIVRLVGTMVNSQFVNTFTEYHNYDVTYSDQNASIEPKANITKDGFVPAEPAGWVDAGQTYRTVILDSSTSFAIATGDSIASVSWDVDDGTITVGTSTSTAITVTFPQTTLFRYISLTVTDTNGKTQTHYFPIWVHSSSNPPLAYAVDDVGFKINRDERAEGRNMTFEFYGEIDGVAVGVIPEGALVCYWEEVDFAGDEPPDHYIKSFIGWTQRDSIVLKLDESRYTIEVGGLQWWLEKFDSFSQLLSDPNTTPNKWYYMEDITVDRVAHYILRSYTDVLRLCNLHFSDYAEIMKEEDIKKSSIWGQLNEIIHGGAMTGIGCDSLNGIWFRPEYNYLETADRGSVATVIDLTPDDWTYDSPLSITNEKLDKLSLVDGNGSSWPGGANPSQLFASRAPGNVPGDVSGNDTLPFQRLPFVDSQDKLNRLTGHHYAVLNNPNEDISIQLIHNFDVIEPCWREIITLTWTEDSVRGTQLVQQEFLVERVTVQHDNEPGQRSKKISWLLKWVTEGDPGLTQPIPEAEAPLALPISPTSPDYSFTLTPFPVSSFPVTPFPTGGGTGGTLAVLPGRAAIRNTNEAVFRTFDIVPAAPVWDDVTPPDYTDIKMVVHDKSNAYHRGAYVLGNDGTDSWISYTSDIYAETPSWVAGEVFDGIYNQLESLKTAGEVIAYAANAGGGSGTPITLSDEMNAGIGPNVLYASATYPFANRADGTVGGVWTAGNGRTGAGAIKGQVNPGDGDGVKDATIILDLGGDPGEEYIVTEAAFWWKTSNTGSGSARHITFWSAAKVQVYQTPQHTGRNSTYSQYGWTGSVSGVRYIAYFKDNSGSQEAYIDDISCAYIDGSVGGAITIYSTDYGANVGAPIAVGTAAGAAAAFATSHYHDVHFAAASGQLMKATTLGGVYGAADDGDTTGSFPIVARVPWYKIGSVTSKNSSSTVPNYYMGSNALISDESLWKITLSGKTDITPDVGAVKAIPATDRSIGTWKGRHIIVSAFVDEVGYVFTSKNAGATWTNNQIDNIRSIRARRQSTSGLEWIAACSEDLIYWSDTGGTSWQPKTATGQNRFAELFG